MHTATDASSHPLRGLLPADAPEAALPVGGEAERDRQFVRMLRAFRETGGLARGDEVADLLMQRNAGDVSRLARWIVTRQVISFDWRGELWVPLFQFELATMALRQETRHLSAELSPVLDGWGVALWCASPHEKLDGCAPADVVAGAYDEVLAAARDTRSGLLDTTVPA